MGSELRTIENFYAARASGNMSEIREFIADDVRWIEPIVGDHMGELQGAKAVLDMM